MIPKISIVTPSFNQGNYIEQTILSILDQNYPNLEYIIIDGGSTDNTIEVIKKYEDRITYWISEPDNGQSDALNKGLAKCTGDLFNWINSDDYLEPGALFELGQIFQQNQNVMLVCGNSRIFQTETNETLSLNRTGFDASIEQTMVMGSFNQQGMFYKLSCIRALGGINENLHYVMDLELFFRYLLSFGIHRIFITEKLFGHFRLHTTSKTVAEDEKFAIEKFNLFSYLLSIERENCFQNYFKKTNYRTIKKWNDAAFDIKNLQVELSKRYFFTMFKEGKTCAARFAFKLLIKTGYFKLNFLTFRLFVKLFIANVKWNSLIKSK